MSAPEEVITMTLRKVRDRMEDLPGVKVGRETVVTTTQLYGWLDQLLWNMTPSVEFRTEVMKELEP